MGESLSFSALLELLSQTHATELQESLHKIHRLTEENERLRKEKEAVEKAHEKTQRLLERYKERVAQWENKIEKAKKLVNQPGTDSNPDDKAANKRKRAEIQLSQGSPLRESSPIRSPSFSFHTTPLKQAASPLLATDRKPDDALDQSQGHSPSSPPQVTTTVHPIEDDEEEFQTVDLRSLASQKSKPSQGQKDPDQPAATMRVKKKARFTFPTLSTQPPSSTAPSAFSSSQPLKPKDKKQFKHVETVRKKADREKLNGFECDQCSKFFDAISEKEQGQKDFNRKLFVNECSRHKHLHEAPSTPPGFWDLSFPSE